jgi:uncharacterized membrane protein YfcA
MFWLTGILIGAISGAVAALCGVGGGIILVPAFVHFFKLDQRTAVVASLAVIIPTALSATARNQWNGLVNWPVVIAASIGAAFVAFFVADTLRSFSNQSLTKIFAILLIAVGIHMLLKK